MVETTTTQKHKYTIKELMQILGHKDVVGCNFEPRKGKTKLDRVLIVVCEIKKKKTSKEGRT